MARAACPVCLRPCAACWCRHLPSPRPACRTKLLLLQHPREPRRAIRTGLMLELGLAEGGCQVFQGEAFPGASSALAERLGARDTFVLYPGETAVPVESLAEGEARRVGTLVLLDGTWEQARKMWRASPALHLLPRLRLSVEGPSEYVVRSQPAAGCLSTLEAAAHALAALEGRPELPELLLRPLRAMCNVQIHHGAGRSDPALFRQENCAYVKRKPQYQNESTPQMAASRIEEKTSYTTYPIVDDQR